MIFRESHQNEISNIAAINYRDQSKMRAMNVGLVDKQRLLLEESLMDETTAFQVCLVL